MEDCMNSRRKRQALRRVVCDCVFPFSPSQSTGPLSDSLWCQTVAKGQAFKVIPLDFNLSPELRQQ